MTSYKVLLCKFYGSYDETSFRIFKYGFLEMSWAFVEYEYRYILARKLNDKTIKKINSDIFQDVVKRQGGLKHFKFLEWKQGIEIYDYDYPYDKKYKNADVIYRRFRTDRNGQLRKTEVKKLKRYRYEVY